MKCGSKNLVKEMWTCHCAIARQRNKEEMYMTCAKRTFMFRLPSSSPFSRSSSPELDQGLAQRGLMSRSIKPMTL